MKILCKIFGHKVDNIENTILKIKNVACNRESFIGDSTHCKRCGEVINKISQ